MKKPKKISKVPKKKILLPPPPPTLNLLRGDTDFEDIAKAEMAAGPNGRQAVFDALAMLGNALTTANSEAPATGFPVGPTPRTPNQFDPWNAAILGAWGPDDKFPDPLTPRATTKLKRAAAQAEIAIGKLSAAMQG